ncbi:LysM peptidoglycan-binding domain-containing protein, partial [Noviherbaspirillum galbum]
RRYDAAGNLIEEKHADGGVERSQYDAFGQRVRLRQANGVLTAYAYNHNGQLTSISSAAMPDMAAAVFDATGKQTGNSALTQTFGYDALGRRTIITAADGIRTKLSYDLRNNLIKQVNAAGTSMATTTLFGHDKFGYQTWMLQQGRKVMTWSYDLRGHVQTHQDLSGTVIQYSYNNLGLLKSQKTGSVSAGHLGQDTVFEYDKTSGLLTRITNNISHTTTRYSYDLAGNRVREKTAIERDGRETNALQDNHVRFDALGRNTDIADGRYSMHIDYDANGNRVHETTRYIDDDGAQRTTDAWNAYDALNRETIIDGTLVNGQAAFDTSNASSHVVTYDNAGNRLTVRQNGLHAMPVSDNEQQQSGWSNIAGVSELAYRYDAVGRLSATWIDGVEAEDRLYDAGGRVVVSGALHLGDKPYIDQLAAVLAANGINTDVHRNTYDAAGKIAQQQVFSAATVSTGTVPVEATAKDHHINPVPTPAGTTLPGAIATTTTTYRYDGNGDLQAYELQQGGKTTLTIYGYDYFDDQVTSQITVRRGSETASSTSTYDGYGHLTDVHASRDAAFNDRVLYNDSNGRVLEKDQNGQRLHSLVVQGEVLGSSGERSNGVLTDTFGSDYVPVSAASQDSGPAQYRVQKDGETLQSIAKAVWGDASLWYVLADANGMAGDATLKAGDMVTIPVKSNAIRSDYQTVKAYDASKVIGDLAPSLPMPAADQGCGVVGQVIQTVIVVVVSAYFGPIAGNIAGQFAGNMMGTQDGFNLKSMAMAAVSEGVSEGMPNMPSTGNTVADTAVRAAAVNATTQAISVATGLQDHFSWANVAGAALGSMAGDAIGEGLKDSAFAQQFGPRGVSIARAIGAGMVTAAARGGSVSVGQVARDAFGNELGNSLNDVIRASQSEFELQRQEDMRQDSMASALGLGRFQGAAPISMVQLSVPSAYDDYLPANLSITAGGTPRLPLQKGGEDHSSEVDGDPFGQRGSTIAGNDGIGYDRDFYKKYQRGEIAFRDDPFDPRPRSGGGMLGGRPGVGALPVVVPLLPGIAVVMPPLFIPGGPRSSDTSLGARILNELGSAFNAAKSTLNEVEQ